MYYTNADAGKTSIALKWTLDGSPLKEDNPTVLSTKEGEYYETVAIDEGGYYQVQVLKDSFLFAEAKQQVIVLEREEVPPPNNPAPATSIDKTPTSSSLQSDGVHSTPSPSVVVPLQAPPKRPRIVHFEQVIHEHSFDTCQGSMDIDRESIRFRSNKHEIVIFRSEVEKRHRNGVKMLNGKKWHFQFPNMSKEGTIQLFDAWLADQLNLD